MTKETSIDREWAARFETLIDSTPDAQHEATAEFSVFLGEVYELLTPEEMARADGLAVQAGVSGSALMEKAGLAVAETARSLLPAGGRVAVMTGPGNNGGDGYVAARLLAEAGFETTVWMAASREKLSGDAAFAAAAWTGSAKGLSSAITDGADLIIDAVFGAGLSKPVQGILARTFETINESGIPVIAVDLPSGIDGASGQVKGAALKARETVTFFRMKPGHVLYPGRAWCGRIGVADIGIPNSALDVIRPKAWRNHPGLWTLPKLEPEAHKYDRGHTIAVAGKASATGAARLAARGALRAGSGLVTVATPAASVPTVAGQVTAIMVAEADGPAGLSAVLEDERRNSIVMGPGLGVGAATRALVAAALSSKAAVVLDADALTSYADEPGDLYTAVRGRDAPVVLTPHDGEFVRLFGDLGKLYGRPERARMAADLSGAVVVAKGPDSVVAAPDGRVAINDNAPPQLATAGSGDVLAGIVAGLLAQGMDAFEAATAAVWLHGAAGRSRGRGLIAEDIPEALPAVFAGL